jgi:DNA-binding transcriptional LysR family regulator
MPLFPVCSPALLQRHGVDSSEKHLAQSDISAPALASIPLLCENRSLDLWQAWYGSQAWPLGNPRRVIDDANVRTQAAVDGQGWTMADALMQRELEAGDLVAPFAHQLEGYGYAIQASPARYVNRKALELRGWLVDQA